jgi:hypothetical protein
VHGFPEILLSSTTQSASDFFNKLLQELKQDVALILKRKIRSDSQHKLWTKFRDELFAQPEDLQFFCCESIKEIRYVVTRRARYHRRVVNGSTPAAAGTEPTDDKMDLQASCVYECLAFVDVMNSSPSA